jgi:hypothetical protein
MFAVARAIPAPLLNATIDRFVDQHLNESGVILSDVERLDVKHAARAVVRWALERPWIINIADQIARNAATQNTVTAPKS